MSMYSGIQEVKQPRRSQEETKWIQPGKFELEVTRVADGKADQGVGSPFFVVEFEVLESSNPEISKGDTVSWMTMRKKFEKYFLADVSNFIAAATNSHPHEVTPEVVEECTGDSQPLVGVVLSANAYNKQSQNTGKDFTVVNYKSHRPN